MATSAASHGTVETRRATGAPVPADWVVGDTLLPLGGPKGTGLALAVDVLAGVLSGAGASGPSPAVDYQGVWLLVLDPARFLPPGQLEVETERLVDHVHSAPAAGPSGVLVPGEPAARAFAHNLRDGVPVADPDWQELRALARELDIEVPIPDREEPA